MECWRTRKRKEWVDSREAGLEWWMIMPLVIHHGAAHKSHVTLVIFSVIGMAEQKVNMRLYVNWRRNSYWPWLVNHSLPVSMDRINTIVSLQMNIFFIKECAPNALIKSRTQKWRGRITWTNTFGCYVYCIPSSFTLDLYRRYHVSCQHHQCGKLLVVVLIYLDQWMLHVYRLVLFALMWNGARRHFLACSAAFYKNASICSFAHSRCIIIIIIILSPSFSCFMFRCSSCWTILVRWHVPFRLKLPLNVLLLTYLKIWNGKSFTLDRPNLVSTIKF
jgi:hypothetical protein